MQLLVYLLSVAKMIACFAALIAAREQFGWLDVKGVEAAARYWQRSVSMGDLFATATVLRHQASGFVNACP